MAQFEIAIVQLVLALISGSVVSGITLFRWGIYAQKITTQLEERIELIAQKLREQNEITLHKLTILEKDINHSEEISNLKTQNDISTLQSNLTLAQSRITDIERYLMKTNGFKIRSRDE